MKILNGAELAGFIKERQVHEVASVKGQLKRQPTLLIIRDSDNPVIKKYVGLKIAYGADIGIKVIDYLAQDEADIAARIAAANDDDTIDGVILQLPITDKERTDELTALIAPEKDVDGLSGKGDFDSATATAILWLLAGYDIKLKTCKIAVVGRGKLVGAPIYKMLTNSGCDVTLFHRGSDIDKLVEYDVIITATGVPGLITSAMVRPGAVVVDAGTASEKGILLGDVAGDVRERRDLAAITPIVGGVGPLTVTCLFEHVIQAAKKYKS